MNHGMGNTDKKPKTVAEAVAMLMKSLPEKEKKKLKKMKKEELFKLHMGFGMGIRNEFGLWDMDSPLLKDCGVMHPDSASSVIIKALWKALQEE